MMLRLDFLGKTTYFTNPITIITTYSLKEVLSCLQQVEQAIAAGYYAVGYVAYEAASAFNPHLLTANPHDDWPLIWFAIFNQPTSHLPNHPTADIRSINWQANVNHQQYQQAIETIKSQIAEGNTYQTNYTIRLNGHFDQDPYALYLHLLQAQRADYSAYLDLGDKVILSASPELFFHYQQGRILTKPMKGTAARGLTSVDDEIQRQQLFSEKNQAENMMIVDLLRNDLNQVAKTGTVNVEQLFASERYPTVWQMTSTISAELPPSISMTQLFTALFPCGSITGAPKQSTMAVITDLEGEARGVYCGAIGMITPDDEAIFNVAIRTLTLNKNSGQAQYGVGGGITWDSTAKDEYQEIINKAQILYQSPLPHQLLESLLLEDGNYFLLNRHLERLAASADYFGFTYSSPTLQKQLYRYAEQYKKGAYKVRVLLAIDGQLTLSVEPITKLCNQPLYASFADKPVNSRNPFLYHKTTRREFYPAATLNKEYLLFNERDEITEFVNGNIVLIIDGEWLTPELHCGLLPGTLRSQWLIEQKIKPAILTRSDIKRADKIIFINSVRKWRNVCWQG
ncbi:MAG: aminodeoxychorismate synthase component I [Candidatus Schmidhempelia sp.]|nr:aminodeoxychorismate synthase component I [Candidatus Schmidhempelia sp.]